MSDMTYRGVKYSNRSRSKGGNIRLDQVFGVSSVLPEYTYVDRCKLDSTFRYIVGSNKHVVIYGASKQGKTVLRKKNLPEENCIKIQCTSSTEVSDIYTEIIRQLDVKLAKSGSAENTDNYGRNAKLSAEIKTPIARASGELGESHRRNSRHTTQYEITGNSSDNIYFITDIIKQSAKRVVIEDFHYLSEDEKKKFAFSLKSFWDSHVFFIIVGVWSEENYLQLYNGDLAGRVNEIDVRWTDSEIGQVISKGEKTLRIKFSEKIINSLIKDSMQNVGLLQRLAEKLCMRHGITERQQDKAKSVSNFGHYANIRKKICDEDSRRYIRFGEIISKGLRRNISGRGKNPYEKIIGTCLNGFTHDELCEGISREELLEKIRDKYRLSTSSNSIYQALRRLEKLQQQGEISPIVFLYNEKTHKIKLADKQLLFFKDYSGHQWPWD